MPRNESQYKISWENHWYFPMYFNSYLKIWHFSHIPQFWQKIFVGYFKSQISKCPNHMRILPHVLCYRKSSGQFNKQKLLGRSLRNTILYLNNSANFASKYLWRKKTKSYIDLLHEIFKRLKTVFLDPYYIIWILSIFCHKSFRDVVFPFVPLKYSFWGWTLNQGKC